MTHPLFCFVITPYPSQIVRPFASNLVSSQIFSQEGVGAHLLFHNFTINEAKVINFRLIFLLEINQNFIKLIISQYSFLKSCMHYNLEDDLI